MVLHGKQYEKNDLKKKFKTFVDNHNLVQNLNKIYE